MDLSFLDKNKTYFITGAAGFIGFHLSKALLENNLKVVGYDNLNDYYSTDLKQARLDILSDYKNFIFYKSDLEDYASLEQAFKQHTPNIVINLAAQAGVRYSLENPHAYIQANVVGFTNILEVCRHFDVEHLLYASSSSVYGSNKKLPFSVDDRVDNPISLYAATKKANELLAHTYSHLFKLPTTGLRFFTVYGPWGRPDMAAYLFLDAINNNKPIKVFNNGDMQRDFTYVEDIVFGITSLINKSKALSAKQVPPYKVYNIGNNRPEELLEFISILEEYSNKQAIKELLPLQAGDVPSTYADIEDLQNDTGFAPNTKLRDGLKQFVEWYKSYNNI